MKKLLIGLLAVLTMLALVACQKKEEVKPSGDVEPVVVEEITPAVVSGEAEEEQVGVGNTDESMVALALERYFLENFSGEVLEVNPVEIKVFSAAEISGDEAMRTLQLSEGDIVFDAHYELKIAPSGEKMPFTAATGVIDGDWVKEKYNVGVARNYGADGYKIDPATFGTSF